MITTTTGAIRALRRHGHLCLSRNPGDGDTWTICSDPAEPGDPAGHIVAEGLAHQLLEDGIVTREPGGWFVLTGHRSGSPD
jgi:hypothetical protein